MKNIDNNMCANGHHLNATTFYIYRKFVLEGYGVNRTYKDWKSPSPRINYINTTIVRKYI